MARREVEVGPDCVRRYRREGTVERRSVLRLHGFGRQVVAESMGKKPQGQYLNQKERHEGTQSGKLRSQLKTQTICIGRFETCIPSAS